MLGTHQRGGVARWLYQEVPAPLVRRSALPALFVPPSVDGFVDFDTSGVRLRRILLPIDLHPHPRPAVAALPGIIGAFHAEPVTVELQHVGTAATMPRVHLSQVDGSAWTTHVTEGDVVEEILWTREAGPADLLVLTTQGRRGFLDALRGSTTENGSFGAPAVRYWPCRPLYQSTMMERCGNPRRSGGGRFAREAVPAGTGIELGHNLAVRLDVEYLQAVMP